VALLTAAAVSLGMAITTLPRSGRIARATASATPNTMSRRSFQGTTCGCGDFRDWSQIEEWAKAIAAELAEIGRQPRTLNNDCSLDPA
jgi:hypothetical protein